MINIFLCIVVLLYVRRCMCHTLVDGEFPNTFWRPPVRYNRIKYLVVCMHILSMSLLRAQASVDRKQFALLLNNTTLLKLSRTHHVCYPQNT
jgi:hypothetical protein